MSNIEISREKIIFFSLNPILEVMRTTTCLQGYPNLILFEVSNVKEMVARVANVVQLDFCRLVGKSLQSSLKEQIDLDKTPHCLYVSSGVRS